MSSFLYILKHRNQPSFKIGKANDIWTRLKCIGGAASFDIENSHCIQFDSVDAAYRAERLLHRCFDGFLYGIDEANRYDGDTEHFKIEAWDRVIAFCQTNLDLIGGVLSDVPAARVMAVKVTPKKTEKQKNDLPLKTFYNHWDWHVGMLENLEKINRYLKEYPVGIYEIFPGKYSLIAEDHGEMLGFPHDLGWDFSCCFMLRGKNFGTSLISGVQKNHGYFIGDLIQSPDEFLDKVDMAVECLDKTDPFYPLEVERLVMVGSIVSSLPVWTIGDQEKISRLAA